MSSTYVDLVEERQAALKAILEIGQMPAGMELFPASDDSAWDLIKDVIDASDYYVLIIGGRYGSLDETGLGYTEKEYDYAVSTGKPVIALLHQSPESLERARTDTEPDAWKRLQEFRAKVEKRHTRVSWTSPDDLKSKVIVGLTTAMKRTPRVGWLRADELPTEATIADVLRLRNRVSELESIIERARITPPAGTADLEQGDDVHAVKVGYRAFDDPTFDHYGSNAYTVTVKPTWDEIFGAIAPTLINEASDAELRKVLKSFLAERCRDAVADDPKVKGRRLGGFVIAGSDEDTCVVQLRALGLIRESIKPRGVRDTATYWGLSPYGDHLMTQLRAVHRPNTEEPAVPATASEAQRTSRTTRPRRQEPTEGA